MRISDWSSDVCSADLAEQEQCVVSRVAHVGDVEETAATRIDNAELLGITAGQVADEAGRATVVAVMAQQRRIDDIVEADERDRNAEGADPQIVSEDRKSTRLNSSH